MTGHETDTHVATSNTADTRTVLRRASSVPTPRVVVPEAARHECLVCGEGFYLTPANHDGFGVVCPHCDGLN